jgi:hypothetical protein
MNLHLKKIVFSSVLLLSMLLCYSVYFHQSDFLFELELVSEKKSNSDGNLTNHETHEEESLLDEKELFSICGTHLQLTYYHFFNHLSRPYFSIWQPPQLI